MEDPGEDLRSTSESIQDDAEQLRRLEARKSELDPADPLVDELARQIENLVRRISDKLHAERDLSEEINAG